MKKILFKKTIIGAIVMMTLAALLGCSKANDISLDELDKRYENKKEEGKTQQQVKTEEKTQLAEKQEDKKEGDKQKSKVEKKKDTLKQETTIKTFQPTIINRLVDSLGIGYPKFSRDSGVGMLPTGGNNYDGMRMTKDNGDALDIYETVSDGIKTFVYFINLDNIEGNGFQEKLTHIMNNLIIPSMTPYKSVVVYSEGFKVVGDTFKIELRSSDVNLYSEFQNYAQVTIKKK